MCFYVQLALMAEEGSIQTTGYTERTHIVDSDLITQKPHPLNKRIRNLTSDFLGGQFELFGYGVFRVFGHFWDSNSVLLVSFLLFRSGNDDLTSHWYSRFYLESCFVRF